MATLGGTSDAARAPCECLAQYDMNGDISLMVQLLMLVLMLMLRLRLMHRLMLGAMLMLRLRPAHGCKCNGRGRDK